MTFNKLSSTHIANIMFEWLNPIFHVINTLDKSACLFLIRGLLLFIKQKVNGSITEVI